MKAVRPMAERTAAGYLRSWRVWQRPTRQEVGSDTQISPPVQPLTLHPPVVNKGG
jgi:hypothetical protein